MAKVIKFFKGVKDGEILPTEFEPGDTVEGDLAIVAVQEGWAEGKKSVKAAPKNKARSGAPSQAGRVSKKKTAKKRAKRSR